MSEKIEQVLTNFKGSSAIYKKLLVMYRIEPGCLGPQGADYVEEFCVFAKQSNVYNLMPRLSAFCLM